MHVCMHVCLLVFVRVFNYSFFVWLFQAAYASIFFLEEMRMSSLAQAWLSPSVDLFILLFVYLIIHLRIRLLIYRF